MRSITPEPRLLALATAVPPYVLRQDEVRTRAAYLFAEAGDVERLLPVYDHAGIDTRYSCVPIDWYHEAHGWEERHRIYIKSAVDLLESVARNLLAQARLTPGEIDAVVVVSTTGIATPSLDALLIERLGLRPDVQRLPLFGFGCAGGVLGLGHAAALARLSPESRVLYLVVELCGLCFRKNDYSKSNIVAAALFGDGAAGAIIGGGDGPRLGAAGQHTWRKSLDVMGWAVEHDGLRAIFSRDIPTFVRERMRSATLEFLARNHMTLADVDGFICHPGGAKVISALEVAFGIGNGALDDARGVLRDYGNMSAATVLFVLERTLAASPPRRALMTAMGPGFTAGFLVVDTR